ncbi:MAG: B12-binding domain-containing radical SAM protein [Deltaproteobacteria bacterium]|nr:B12-binding domain-containing radical SAM protein [Deltaproteobacteria bacterium]
MAVRDMNIECFAKCGEYLKTWWEPENLKYWSPGDRFKEVSAFLLPQIEAFVDDIAKKRPIVVGFSVNESNLPFTNRVAERIREKLPMAKVIYGGAGIAWPEERRKLVSEAVDGFVIGEGEVALPSLLDALMNGGVWEDVPGLEWAGGPIEKEPSKDLLIPSLDALPTPDFSDFPLGLYQTRQLPLEFGRGCPNRCTFCNDPKIMPKYRFKSPERMLEDVKHYKQLYGGHDFQFNDLLINAHVENLRRFAELVVRDGVRMAYSGQAIINKRLTDETLAVLKQSGCTSLVFGVESFSDKVLDSMKKGYDSTMARTVIERVHRAGIKVIVNLIVGFPGETELELNETMEFLRAHRHMIDSVSALSACIVTPQCDLERHPEKYGIVLPKPEHWCQWYTEDGANTYDVRQKRLYKMIALCDELGLMRGMTNRYLEMVDGRAVAQA